MLLGEEWVWEALDAEKERGESLNLPTLEDLHHTVPTILDSVSKKDVPQRL
jgi:hypothetical protein